MKIFVKLHWLVIICLISMGLMSLSAPTIHAQTDEEPTNFEAGLSHFWNRYYADAIPEFTAAIDEDPEAFEAYVYRGEAYVKTQEFDLALADFDTAAGLDLENPLLYALRANYFIVLEDYESAQADIDASLGFDPEFSLGYFFWGELSYAVGEYETAIEHYEEALKLESPYAEELTLDYHATLYMYVGLTYDMLGDYEEALANVQLAIEQDDEDAWFHQTAGIYANALERYDEALVYSDTALKLNPEYRRAYIERGYTKIQLGDYEGAIEDLTQALTLEDGDSLAATAHGNLGFAYDQTGDHVGAMAEYIIAHQMDPSLQWVNYYVSLQLVAYLGILPDDFATGTWVADRANGPRPNSFNDYFEINYPCGALGLSAIFHDSYRYDLEDAGDTFFSQAVFYYTNADLAEDDYTILADILADCELITSIPLDDFTDNSVLYLLESENTDGELSGSVYSVYYQRGNVIEVLTYGASGDAASTLDAELIQTLATLTLERLEAAPILVE